MDMLIIQVITGSIIAIGVIIGAIFKYTPYIPAKIVYYLSGDPKNSYEIKALINQSLKQDYNWKQTLSEYRLKRIFKRRMEKIEKEEELKWQKLEEKVVYRPLNDEEIIFYMSGMEIRKYKKEFSSYREVVDNMDKYKSQLPNLRKKYAHIRIFSFKNESETKWILDYINRIGKPIEESKGIPLRNIGFFENEYRPMTKEDFLNDNGYPTPIIHNSEEIETIYKDIFFFLERQSDNKINFIQELAEGLSNDKDSDKLLLELINEVEKDKSINESKKIQKKIKELGI